MDRPSRRVRSLLVALLAVAATAASAADPTPQQAEADMARLLELSERFAAMLAPFTGGSLIYETTEEGMLQNADKLLTDLKAVEPAVVPVVQPVLAEMAGKYGADENEVYNKLFELKVAQRDEGSRAFGRLHKGLTNLSATRKKSAQYLVDYVKALPQITFFAPDVRLKKAGVWKELLSRAVLLDPNSAEAHAQLASIDQVVALAASSVEQEAEATRWLGHVNDFAGPGTTEALAKAAVEYFRVEPTWGGSDRKITVLAVAIRGHWQVAEANVFGQVIQWRLPVCLAISTPDYLPRNLARIYNLSLLAKVGAPGAAPKSPPFDGFWVGDSKMIRPAKVPAAP